MKKLFIVLSLVLAISVPLTVFAATSDTPVAQTFRGWCGFDASTLTDQQKADLNDTYQKMIDLRKESINKMVENGTITKEQGDAAIKRIDDMDKYRQENGAVGGRMGRMGRIGGGFRGGMFNNVPAQTVPVQ
ncbi:MAG: hypothetical protein APF77_06935 [Clostridia bacterium BRH_c25]|nr:MAG: hypothetical protein APF77_06935 [Clostridia bacterium BRH_c25]